MQLAWFLVLLAFSESTLSILTLATTSTSDMLPRKAQTIKLFCSSATAQSLDDDDPFVFSSSSLSSSSSSSYASSSSSSSSSSASSSSSSSSSPILQNPHAVKLCKSLINLQQQLKQLEGGCCADPTVGSDTFEVSFDRSRDSVEVRWWRESSRGLETATKEARERVANLIAKRKQDIMALEEESATLNTCMEQSEEEEEEALLNQLCSVRKMIGKHKFELRELERKDTVEVEVEVERVSTRVEVVKEETIKVEKQRWLVPMNNVGIYVFGGRPAFCETTMSTVERYDAAEDKWEAVAPSMTCARQGHASAVLGDTIYVIGGYNTIYTIGFYNNTFEEKSLKSVERFSARSGQWELVAPMPTPRSNCVAVERFDPTTNMWTYVAPLSGPRADACAAVLDGRIYVMGGFGIYSPRPVAFNVVQGFVIEKIMAKLNFLVYVTWIIKLQLSLPLVTTRPCSGGSDILILELDLMMGLATIPKL
eukprot:g46324.t1